MEIDYLNDDWGPANDYFQSLPLDYRIGSVHFIPTRGETLSTLMGARIGLLSIFGSDLAVICDMWWRPFFINQ